MRRALAASLATAAVLAAATTAPRPRPRRVAGEDDDVLRDDRRRPRRAVLAAEAAARLEARRPRRPRRGAAQGPPRSAGARCCTSPSCRTSSSPTRSSPLRVEGLDLGGHARSRLRGARRRRSSRSGDRPGHPPDQPLRRGPDPQPRHAPRAGWRSRPATSADNQQINEVKWVVRLLEGGRLDPNSGVEDGQRGSPAPRVRPRATPACRTTTTSWSPAASGIPTARRGTSRHGRAGPA